MRPVHGALGAVPPEITRGEGFCPNKDGEMAFRGYSKDGLRFLSTLGTKDKGWFGTNRAVYDQQVVAPTKALVTALGSALADAVSSEIVAQPRTNGSISPINNDLRFSPDKSPYKDHLLLRFWEGSDKKTAPTLFVRISESTIGFATGVNFVSVDRWRTLVDDNDTGSQLSRAIVKLAKGRRLDVAGQALKKVPRPYASDHPRADLLKHKVFQARWPEPTPKQVHSEAFVAWCLKRLVACAPVHRWLVEHKP